ncbi:MAG: pitrilysin family protein [Thermoplasmata archaeon]
MPHLGRPSPIDEFVLPNGLRVLLCPLPESPTASVWVWYRVGSRNEWLGITGASHWVEHMLFQGSPRYTKGAIDRAIVSVGGTLNAFTDSDFTAYFSIVPREHLALPLDIEADRMTRALFAPEEVERERTVIYSEREGNENWPEFQAEEELYALAFRIHPYRWETLGHKEDIRNLTPDQLASYYRRFYGPKNAILVIAGGLDPVTTRDQVEAMFSPLPAEGDDPRVSAVEPAPRGERRGSLSGPGTTPFLRIGWRAPAFADPSTPAVMLLDVILGGETRLFTASNSWFRSSEHPSSRLFRSLVEPGLALRASSEFRPKLDPGLFTVHAQAAAEVSLDRLEERIHKEIDRLVRRGPTRTEILEARTKVRRGAELAYEGASRAGFRLGYLATLGASSVEGELLHRVLTTSPKAVRAAASDIFRPSARTVVRYEPTEVVGDD